MKSVWTNPSVVEFAKGQDPIDAIIDRAQHIVYNAIQAGWAGPPFDPYQLAELLKVKVIPYEDVVDARTRHVGNGKYIIEFNPNRPPHRIRYSICHELAHTLFTDCHRSIRHRGSYEDTSADNWQLESLCNLAAAEFLMPHVTLNQLKIRSALDQQISIDYLKNIATEFGVSTEAMLIRVVRLTQYDCCAFSSSNRRRGEAQRRRYALDYIIPSKKWKRFLPIGLALPLESVVEGCTAIGFTAKGHEEWPGISGQVYIECVGIPPYPGHLYPRVSGIIYPKNPGALSQAGLTYIKGDATEPRGQGLRVIAHIVNDKTPMWGGRGFASYLRQKWPSVQDDFKSWAFSAPSRLSLGEVHKTVAGDDIQVVHMIAQHGYGPSSLPRIRYMALKKCLEQLATIANQEKATIHLPRIGCGEAGGRWDMVEELIEEALCANGINVTIYDLPRSVKEPAKESLSLFDEQPV